MSKEITVKEILWQSPEYQQELVLRNEVLRKPLGMNLFDQDLSLEKDYLRVAAFDGQTVVGTLLLVPLNDRQVQMKQMAVRESFQKQNVGRRIIEFSEALLKERGFQEIMMHAREYAIPFYRKLGYDVLGDRFEEVGIPHFIMRKDLN